MARMETRFGTGRPYTVGVEEEFQLVDPSSRELAPAIEAVLDAAPEGSERMAPELFQDCVEMRSPVFSTVAELSRELGALRRPRVGTPNTAWPVATRLLGRERLLPCRLGLGARRGQHLHRPDQDVRQPVAPAPVGEA